MRTLSVADRSQFHLDPIKGSRFIATVAPAATEGDALAVVEDVRAEFSDARHHCWAYRLREQSRSRSSDDGEPGGSAGRPTLAQIDGHGLEDVVVVVTRYFGGVKLGVGGLIRAYGGCAGKALDTANIVTVIAMTDLTVTHAYPDTAPVDAIIGQEGLTRKDADYGADVTVVLAVALEDLDRIRRAFTDATSGRAQLASSADPSLE